MSKLRPISLSSPTGTNSVVLKMNAASASATTLSQRPLAAVVSILVMRVIEPGEMQGGEPAPRSQQHSREKIADSRTAPGRGLENANSMPHGAARQRHCDQDMTFPRRSITSVRGKLFIAEGFPWRSSASPGYVVAQPL